MMDSELARKIGEEYRTLQEIEARLREVLASQEAPAEWIRRTSAAFEHLRAHLVRLFALEETQGCHAAIVEQRPEKEPEVERFHDEHRAIMARADSLMLSLRSASAAEPPTVADLRNAINDLLGTVRRHEANESQLVQLIFSQDVSVND